MSFRIPPLADPIKRVPPVEESSQSTDVKKLPKNTTRKKVSSYIKENQRDLFTIALFTGFTITAIALIPLGVLPLGAGIACIAITAIPTLGGFLSQRKQIKKVPVSSYGKETSSTQQKRWRRKKAAPSKLARPPSSRPPEIPQRKTAFAASTSTD